MSRYISPDWIGRETAEVERYVRDKASVLASSLNNFIFTVPAAGAILTGVEALKIAKNSILNNEYAGSSAQQNKNNVEALISSIIDMFKYSNVKEPISSITGIYYTDKLILNQISQQDPLTGTTHNWPFSSFILGTTYEKSKIKNVNTTTNFISYEQDISVIFDYFGFRFNFLNNYLSFLDRTITNDDQAVISIYFLFVISFKRMLEEQTNNKFINFNRETVVDASQEEIFAANASINSEYNFYIKEYEKQFDKNFTSLQVLPNYYLLNSYINTQEEQRVKDVVSLNNRFNVTEQTILSQQYYLDFVKTIKSMSKQEIDDVVKKTTNYLIDVDYANTTKTSLSDEVLPYNNKIVFTNDRSDQISSFLNQNKLQTLFASNIYNTLAVSNTLESLLKNNNNLEQSESESLSFSYYSDTVKYNFSDNNGKMGFVLLPNSKEDFIRFTNNIEPNITGALSLFTFIKLQNLLLQSYDNNDFKKLFSCTPNKSFSCGYLIEKTDPTNQNSLPFQTIVMARDNSISNYEIIDTQVTYDKELKYTIYSLELTPRNEYSYSFLSDTLEFFNGSNNVTTTITIRATLNPQLCFFKTKLYEKNATILDNPPLPVDVNIVPFVGVNNALRFLFNTQIGSYTETPIPITQKDIRLFESIKQKRNIKDNKLFFETDDFITSIQVFRTTEYPSSYADFRNSLYLTIDMKSLTSANFIDTIEPNKKYYYIFRSTDVHNNISNPTALFEVEIVDNDGAIYPIIKTVPFQNNKNYDNTVSFKKYISITPSITQTAFIPNQDNTQVTFGEKQDLWGQKFKLRFTSKKTGKSFDLNFTFAKE